jgi:hypothetical protein
LPLPCPFVIRRGIVLILHHTHLTHPANPANPLKRAVSNRTIACRPQRSGFWDY